MTNKRTNLFLDDHLVKEIKKIAIEEDTSVSRIVTKLLQGYIYDYKNGNKSETENEK